MAETINNRTAMELLRAFQVMEQKSIARGLKPILVRLDNESSQLLKNYLFEHDTRFQVVPPYSHRWNTAERATRSFKDHLIAGLCPSAPMGQIITTGRYHIKHANNINAKSQVVGLNASRWAI
jgi:hypothetical protein